MERKNVLFLITELHRPVGGLSRFATELFSAWREKEHVGYSPIVVSMRVPEAPLGDLKICEAFREFGASNKMRVYEAMRGGVNCFFLESYLDENEKNHFHKELWDAYRIKSEKSSHQGFYKQLNAYWKAAALFAQELESRMGIAVVDAQDWLAFPAGFLIKERLNKPLVCRFHSGEAGRSMGHPDWDDAPIRIEAAALQEADFVVGVSVSEMLFELGALLPHKKWLRSELRDARGADWNAQQEWRENQYESFMLLEGEKKEQLALHQCCGGMPNGILLDEWKKMNEERIHFGRVVLEKLLPGKKKYVMFIGRPDARKGLDPLLEAIASLQDSSIGLIANSAMNDREYASYQERLKTMGIADRVIIYTDWLREDLKKSLFCASDVIALPSTYEPFGLVMLEAFAADLACERNSTHGPVTLVGDTGGMGEVVRNGVNGFKAPIRDFRVSSQDLAALLRIALNDDSVKKKISRNAAESVLLKQYDWQYLVLKVFEAYARAEENHDMWRSAHGKR